MYLTQRRQSWRNRGIKKTYDIQETNSQKEGINSTFTLSTLNINGLNTTIKVEIVIRDF